MHNDLLFLSERMKRNKCNKLVCNLYDKKLCCSHKIFKTGIKTWINTKKVHRVIQFNQKAQLNEYIATHTISRTKA